MDTAFKSSIKMSFASTSRKNLCFDDKLSNLWTQSYVLLVTECNQQQETATFTTTHRIWLTTIKTDTNINVKVKNFYFWKHDQNHQFYVAGEDCTTATDHGPPNLDRQWLVSAVICSLDNLADGPANLDRQWLVSDSHLFLGQRGWWVQRQTGSNRQVSTWH